MIDKKIIELPYIKPTRRIHSSGYRIFEVGYCWEEGGKFKHRVIGGHSDHIKIDNINIDLTRKGYIRFFVFAEGKSKDCQLRWEGKTVFSTAELKLVKNHKEKE